MMGAEEFRREATALDTAALYQVGDAEGDAVLERINRLYGAADALSVANARVYKRVLWAIAAAATLFTLFFLLYDEAELYGLIAACGVMLAALALLSRHARRLDCHGKYLEYRVLAEGARVGWYLRYAGAGATAAELTPWSLKQSIPWAIELLQDSETGEPGKKRSVLAFWIDDQRSYHERALARTRSQQQVNERISRAALVATVVLYLATFALEIAVAAGAIEIAGLAAVRAALKIALGVFSAATLFCGSTLGKLSLENVIADHERMIALYDDALARIEADGESEQLVISLARECLGENATWYAYQSMNAPDVSL